MLGRKLIIPSLEMVTAMMKSIMPHAAMMVEIVVDLVSTQPFVQNVLALVMLQEMESVILYLEMAFAMMKPIMLNAITMVETVVSTLTQIIVLSVAAIVKILNLLVMASVIMKQTMPSATMMVETVVDLLYLVSDN